MTDIECFLIEPTDRAKYFLRRYAEGECQGMEGSLSYHNAIIEIESGPEIYLPKENRMYSGNPEVEHFRFDPRWPLKCEGCDYYFLMSDYRQVNTKHIYKRVDIDEEYTIEEAPAGATWENHWIHEGWRNPEDNKCYDVKLPPGDAYSIWHIDGKSSSGGKWVRTGIAPKFTVTPSILTNKYHGFLTDGKLVSV